jgi:hypothetical protein
MPKPLATNPTTAEEERLGMSIGLKEFFVEVDRA